MVDGDVIIVRSQPDAESEEIAVVIVSGDGAAVKKIKKPENAIALMPLNPAFDHCILERGYRNAPGAYIGQGG
ncbi:MAG TPA: hypothetical protein IAA60_09625 [Candidatus Ornithomonoglobus intestinigallinarum]|uniref:Peptidase S24/S26A/S26B/S26C domain-containing protein n=1 Tax=Candidatus Ornithomonoglobus intestinigallinarum TaxID=2840894 RepID=A0A9D1H5L2_9FIRM|nr:hypothetical protein [Candidatus Ornithomonoglobus intestinigallinarum]